MRRNRTRMLNFRAPALVDRNLTYLSGTQYLGHVTVVCFMPYPGIVAAEKIDRVTEGFLCAGVRFLIVASGARPLHRVWSDQQEMPRAPIMGDPCGRLHRLFCVVESEPFPRCRTFIIDDAGVLRLRFTHDFSDHDVAAIHHLVTMDRLYFESAVRPEAVSGEAEYVPV